MRPDMPPDMGLLQIVPDFVDVLEFGRHLSGRVLNALMLGRRCQGRGFEVNGYKPPRGLHDFPLHRLILEIPHHIPRTQPLNPSASRLLDSPFTDKMEKVSRETRRLETAFLLAMNTIDECNPLNERAGNRWRR